MLEHGGGLRRAAKRYGIPLEAWLDVSTGINPQGWPVPGIPASAWSRLPEEDDGLEQAARDYYEAEHVLAVAGSQAAIQALPRLRASTRVSVLEPGYAEHRHAWQRAGHSVVPVGIEQLNEAVRRSNVLVLINPNNPTAACFPAEQLLDWHAQLAARSGWLVVDEAFMDVTPASSLAPHAARPGLIVLRSLGKFFGLAGARVGFVCAHPQLLRQLNALLGPWAVSGPARWVAMEALRDRAWQSAMRQRLAGAESRFQNLLTRHGLAPDGGCALFQWVCTRHAADVHGALARRGVLTRLFHRPAGLRFGLPGDDADWRRLDDALAQTAEWGVNGAAV